MIQFSVGYQLRRDFGWIDAIISHRDRVHEVFFSLVGVPNGRTGVPLPDGTFSLEEQQAKLHGDLQRLRDANIQLNVLYNASCYGKDGQSREFFDRVVEQVVFYRETFGLTSVTTTSPFIAEVVKKNFPDILTRSSVNMGVASILGMDYIADFFDGYYLKQEQNRNIPVIRKLKAWCDEHSKQLFLLANSGCLNDCSIHAFHNNLAAHSDELMHVDKRYPIRGCRDYLSKSDKLISIIRDENWIRPEDIHIYDGMFTSLKLATRIHRHPETVLQAYVDEHYDGSILDLMEPDHATAMLGRKLDNQSFPADFGVHTGFCQKNCTECTYCRDVLNLVLITSEA